MECHHLQLLCIASVLVLAASALPAQTVPPPNYEEARVPQYIARSPRAQRRTARDRGRRLA